MIALRSVSLRSRATGAPVFADLDLHLDAGQLALATGPSGAGKTALTRLLHAATRPDDGQVCVFGHELAKLRASSLPHLRRKVAVVPQELTLLERDSALANAAAGLLVTACPKSVAQKRAMAALERFGMAELARVPVARLSSGQRRRVALARAAAMEPTVLIADDPTAHLDSDGRLALVEFASQIAAGGGCVLMASSDPALAAVAMRNEWIVVDLAQSSTEERTDGGEQSSAARNIVPFPARPGHLAGSNGGPS